MLKNIDLDDKNVEFDQMGHDCILYLGGNKP